MCLCGMMNWSLTESQSVSVQGTGETGRSMASTGHHTQPHTLACTRVGAVYLLTRKPSLDLGAH